MEKDTKKSKTLNKINIFSVEREVILEDNTKLHVVFDVMENGEKYIILTDGEAFIFTKEINGRLEELEDAGEMDIILNLLADFFEENILVDQNGNSIMDKLMTDAEEEYNED
ncbi:hypothetical protein OF364_02910 [Mycoplasma enhydrae]|uniref:hypothetical protein n=1 Tax=Mycoplasma enhydrae TaxID=2499220 RepID=UPI00197BE62A|nr:hypothetical protein [Mycoplasma enhydrae]MBN4089204.1 hypothetical protein [Mycoplasma enhydrae]MCV3733885.1 hypothetical protein [Mycoplasma enhydrae]MCV3753752.1 hypothetical protein [Mycoplasma enhydrae]